MTKSNNKKKQKAVKNHSKFSLMRNKLTLTSKVPSSEYKNQRPDKDSEVEEEGANVNEGKLGNLSKDITTQGKKENYFQRASPMKLVRLYPSMTGEQIKLIKMADYGGLVDIKCSKLQPDLCKFLMESFDPLSCKLVFPGRGSIDVTEQSVHEVIGVPRGDIEVRYELDAEAIEFMRKQLGEKTKRQPTIRSLEKKLAGMKEANNRFLRLFITYGMCSVLAPTTGVHISPRLYPSLINIKHANRLNMCKFVITMLLEATKSGAEKAILKSCMLYFMVKYLDSLELQGINVRREGTRVSAWTNAMVKKAISQDRKSDGSFGLARLKPEFANLSTPSEDHQYQGGINSDGLEEGEVAGEPHEQIPEDNSEEDPVGEVRSEDFAEGSILFSDAEKIDRFIQANIPSGCKRLVTTRFKEAVQQACYGFESNLKVLVKALTHASKSRKRKSKKKSATKRRSRETVTEAFPIDSHSPEHCEQTGGSDEDEDFVNRDDGEENTQTTVSLDEETIHLSLTASANDWFNDEDERYARRKKRGTVGSCGIKEEHVQSSELMDTPDAIESKNLGKETESSNKELEQVAKSVHFSVTTGGTRSEECEGAVQHQTVTPTDNQNTTQPDTAMKIEGSASESNIEAYRKSDGKHRIEGTSSKSPTVVPDKVQMGNSNLQQEVDEIQVEGTSSMPPTLLPHKVQRGNSNLQQEVDEFQVEGTSSTPLTAAPDKIQRGNSNSQQEGDEFQDVKDEDNDKHNSRREGTCNDTLANLCQTYQSTTGSSGAVTGHNEVEEEPSQNTDQWGFDTKSFLEYMKTEIRPKIDMPVFETPVFFDLELDRPYKSGLDAMMKTCPRMEHEKNRDVFASLDLGTPRHVLDRLLAEIEPPKSVSNKRKAVTFADQAKKASKITNNATPSPSRYRTRAAVREEKETTAGNAAQSKASPTTSKSSTRTQSPKKVLDQGEIPPGNNSRRITRSTTVRPSTPDSAPVTLTSNVPSSAMHDPMNRKLIFDSTESERERILEAARLAPDAPPFDLDTPPDANDVKEGETVGIAAKVKSEGPKTVLQPTFRKQANNPSTSSITPVPHELDKRVVKRGKFAQSPFVNPDTKKNYCPSKSQEEVYSMVCQHGAGSGSHDNERVVIDVGKIFITLGHLADSVKPGKKLINIVAELAIHIITLENQNPKKYIMPLRVAKYLIDCRFNLKDVTRCFENSPANRLDHKDIICFPTLEKFQNLPKDSSGHYWLVVLNIKAERFEIIDSLARNAQALMMESCHLLIASIKKMWAKEYRNSKVQIIDWPIEVIDSPKQENRFDCGFFTLKNLEEKHGRMTASFSQKDLPNIRIIYTDKWLRFKDNNIQWQLYV